MPRWEVRRWCRIMHPMTLEPSTPPANVYESNGQLSVAVPLPGAHREHTSIVIRPDHLEVVADCKYAQEDQHYLRRDWQVGSWRLDLALPMQVDPHESRATLHYGVLVVMAPLSDAASGEARPTIE